MNKLIKLFLLVSLSCTFSFHFCLSQTFLNLGFERSFDGRPIGWATYGDGYAITLDTTFTYSGHSSLRIKCTRPSSSSFGTATRSFPLELARGKTITISGHLRTDSIASGFAGIWCRVDGKSAPLAFDNMANRGPRGTTPWQRYELTLPVDSAATAIVFGVLHPGNGTAWFDQLQVQLNGKLFIDTLIEIPVTREQVTWIRSAAIPFTTPKAQTGFRDLQPLKSLIGDAHIVALGEATHGTKEFFQMKHRLTEFLASQMGFTIFAIEANIPEAHRLNDYVLSGKGDPKQLVAGMGFWTWNTQEVLDFVLWMRRFNESGIGRIQFLGFDMQAPTASLQIVQEFVRATDPTYSAFIDNLKTEIDSVFARLRTNQGLDSASLSVTKDCHSFIEHLTQARSQYTKTASADQIDWTFENAHIISQALDLAIKRRDPSGMRFRDSCMAEHVQWIKEHAPSDTRIILWAHNSHVSKRDGFMGSFLANRYGKDYLSIAQTCFSGSYTATDPSRRLAAHPIAPPMPNSLEAYCHAANLPVFILDVRKASAIDTASSWLTRPILMRSIGAFATDTQQIPTSVYADFDAVIYFEHSEASDCFDFARKDK